ncbi:MAG: hypothetical protein LBF28_01430 [Rickettsiales bacterium]|jgi:hypothetical protein|nr:hypothetical protein [Rickettsiales bacterium]
MFRKKNFVFLMFAISILVGCGKKISNKEQVEYDVLFAQRDNLENTREALAICLVILMNTSMIADTNNVNDAQRLIKEFHKTDSINAARMEEFQKKYPKLPKHPGSKSVIEANIVKLR